MRWIHRGKLGNWTEARAQAELQEREDRRVDAFQHASVEALLEAEAHMPGSMGGILRSPSQSKRYRATSASRKRKQRKDACDYENDLLSDDFDEEEQISLNAATLAPSLLRPVLSAHDLLRSRLLKQIFSNPHISALSRTALDLRESEHNMNHALGRCFGAMERIYDADPRETEKSAIGALHVARAQTKAATPGSRVPQEKDEMETDHAGVEASMTQNEDSKASNSNENTRQIEPDGHDSQEPWAHSDGNESTSRPNFSEPLDIVPPLAQINNLFLTKGGLVLPVPENSDPTSAQTITVSEEEQREVLYGSLGSLNDLYTDSREYMERLDEVRSLLADVEWHRGHIWNILRIWASRKDNEEYQALKMYRHAQRGKQGDQVPGMDNDHDRDTETNKSENLNSTSKRSRGNEYASSNGRSRTKKRTGR